jgi:hypothetical protein
LPKLHIHRRSPWKRLGSHFLPKLSTRQRNPSRLKFYLFLSSRSERKLHSKADLAGRRGRLKRQRVGQL